MAERFEHVGVVGVGLIGGSLALAARAAGVVGRITGVGRSQANLDVALQRGIVDRAVQDLAAVGPVDLVVLAVPVGTIAAVGRALVPHLRAGTIVTDVGSVKGPIVTALEAALPPTCPFVGAHPIAGTEASGAAAADAALFRGTRCVLTPTERTEPRARGRVAALWQAVGAQVEEMPPDRHDRTLAWTSHVVHAVAYTLARAIATRDAAMLRLAGPSLRDATRVAATAPALWEDIFLANAAAVDGALAALLADLDTLRRAIAAGDAATVGRWLAAGQAARKRLEGGGQ